MTIKKKKILLSMTRLQLEQLKEQNYLNERGLELLAEVETWDKEDDIEPIEMEEEFDYTHR
jgi:hypothetical protein